MKHMNRSIIFVLCVLFAVSGVSVTASAEGKKKSVSRVQALSKFELGKYQYCGSDGDCIAVQNGCCDCANGGSDAAINKMHLDDFKGRFHCEEVVCTARAKVPPCGSGVVSCVNHECRYVQSADAVLTPPVEKIPDQQSE